MRRITIKNILSKKNKSPITCLTAYTKNVAEIVDKYCDIILVGDSLGMVLYGMKSTREVTIEQMILHGKTVKKFSKRCLVVVDMPFRTYTNKFLAYQNAKKIIKLTKCDALKLEFPYIFSGFNYPGIPKVAINIIENKPFKIEKTIIEPIEVLHYKLPVLGFRIRNFVYLTDVSEISKKEKEKMKGDDLIILDALRKQDHISHFSLEQALTLLEELNPKQALLTHISHYMGLHDNVNKELPNYVNLAYDGQVVTLNE